MDIPRKERPITIYPDPIVNIEMLSGAMFLYFDQPIAVTIPPVIVTENSYALLEMIATKKPKWESDFLKLFNAWQFQLKCCNDTLADLAPLKNLTRIWAVYPADSAAMKKTQEMITLSGLSYDDINEMIDPLNAAGELIRHIMLEAFLEHDGNIEALFNYCENLFMRESIDKLLVKSYLLRLQSLRSLQANTSILITNLEIWNNLLNDNASINIKNENRINNIDRDIIAWEIFKNIVSPKLDPLDKAKAQYIVKLLKTQSMQIEKLKLKCFGLADSLKHINRLDNLPKSVVELVKRDVEKDIMEFFELDKNALSGFLSLVFSDEKAWIGIASFIAGVFSGNSIITTSGAIAALSLTGSKAVQVSAKRKKVITQSDYGLAYTLGRKYK